MTYQEQIKSPKWQKKRLEVLEQNRFKCDECHSEENQLHVHHTYYKKGKKIWEYETYELRSLCDVCHKKTHDLTDNILHGLGMLEIVATIDCKDQVYGYIQGLLGVSDEENPSESFMQGFVDGSVIYDLSERYKALLSARGQ